MSSTFDKFSEYLFIAIGVYCIVRGFMTLTTGNLPASEEARLRGYSENGIRKYKMLSAVTNLIGGVIVIAISVLKLLNLIQSDMLRIILVIILVIMVVVYILLRKSCKNTK